MQKVQGWLLGPATHCTCIFLHPASLPTITTFWVGRGCRFDWTSGVTRWKLWPQWEVKPPLEPSSPLREKEHGVWWLQIELPLSVSLHYSPSLCKKLDIADSTLIPSDQLHKSTWPCLPSGGTRHLGLRGGKMCIWGRKKPFFLGGRASDWGAYAPSCPPLGAATVSTSDLLIQEGYSWGVARGVLCATWMKKKSSKIRKRSKSQEWKEKNKENKKSGNFVAVGNCECVWDSVLHAAVMRTSCIGLFHKLEAPPWRRQKYFKLKIWEFPGLNFDLKNMGILKIVFKNGNSQLFMSKIVRNWEFPFFCAKNNWIFWEFQCLLYPCNQKSA